MLIYIQQNKKPPHPARFNGGTNQKRKVAIIIAKEQNYDKNGIIKQIKRKNRPQRMG